MSRAPLLLLALAVLVAARSPGAAERERAPLTAALEDAAALGAPDTAPAADRPDASSTPIPEPVVAPGNPLWGIPLRALSATRERPLFSPSRRPPAPVVAAAPASAAPTTAIAAKPTAPEGPPLILVGTVVSAQKRVAILFNRATRQVTQVREGEEESGWRVRLVSPRSAVVEKDMSSVTLDLPNPADEPAVEEMPTDAPPPPIAPLPGMAPPRARGGVL
jgi:general secretion pathway protein N